MKPTAALGISVAYVLLVVPVPSIASTASYLLVRSPRKAAAAPELPHSLQDELAALAPGRVDSMNLRRGKFEATPDN